MGQRRVGPDRAQSSALGVVLVLAIVVAGSTLTLALGAEAITSTNGQLQRDRAAQSMTQLDSQIAMVGLGNSDIQDIELSGSGADYAVQNGSGTMTVSYTNLTTGSETTIFEQTMGAIVYEHGDTAIAYQGGGVWRRSAGGGTTMISPPEFHYRDATLTLPLVAVRGGDSLSSSAVVRPNGTTRQFPNGTRNPNFQNPLAGSRVEVAVQSEYYEAWGAYFEERTDGAVRYDPPDDEVTIELVTPLEDTSVTRASASLAASGTFVIQGSAIETCGLKVYSNSYNSSGTGDDYCDQVADGLWGHEGDIVYGDNIDISNGAGSSYLYGDLVSGGLVKVSGSNGAGQPYVYGNINYSTNCQTKGGRSHRDCSDRIHDPDGEVTQIERIPTTGAIDSVVVNTVSEYAKPSTNDNAASPNVTGDRLDFGANGDSDEVWLGDGTYFLEQIDPSSADEITLDTRDGTVFLGVREQVHLDDTDVEVIGDGQVHLYVQGAGSQPADVDLSGGTEITNEGDDAPQFRLFGRSNLTARLSGGAKYVGVIYAPPGQSGTGSVTFAGGELYGGVVTGTTTIESGNGGSLHYDEALENEQMLTRGTNVVRVTYLHVSTNDVIVESG